MDTFEKNDDILRENMTEDRPAHDGGYEEQPQAPAREAYGRNPYYGVGTGRKESPYANSPYVMREQPRQEHPGYAPHYDYQPRYRAPQEPQKPRKDRSGVWKRILAGALVLVLVAAGCGITAVSVNGYWEQRNRQTVEEMNAMVSDLQNQINALSGGNSVSGTPVVSNGLTPGQVYAQSVDSVVAISSTVQSSGFYGTTEGASSGSGFILTADGYVVTNYHVVENATKVDVIVNTGAEYPAKVVGFDAANDLAVLKVEAQDLPAATIGSSDALIIGDMVVAIGNPLGELTSTQTVGYVSGKDRDVTTDGTIISMIQTDAAINPGNSGGPLFNMKGEVVGITTAKYSGTTGSGASIEGIGFAIPIDDVMGIIGDLMEHGYVTGAYMGITVRNTDEEAASMFGLPVGAYVEGVENGGAASRAGIQPKDIIIDLGGHQVTGITTLTRALRNFKAGDTTTVTVIRGGGEKVLEITLDEKPQTQNNGGSGNPDATMPSGDYDEWYNWFFGRDD